MYVCVIYLKKCTNFRHVVTEIRWLNKLKKDNRVFFTNMSCFVAYLRKLSWHAFSFRMIAIFVAFFGLLAFSHAQGKCNLCLQYILFITYELHWTLRNLYNFFLDCLLMRTNTTNHAYNKLVCSRFRRLCYDRVVQCVNNFNTNALNWFKSRM